MSPWQGVERFMLACVGPAKGSSVSWAELYTRYRRWCSDEGLSAMSADMFGKRLDRLRAEGVLRSRVKGEDVYCLASSSSRERSTTRNPQNETPSTAHKAMVLRNRSS